MSVKKADIARILEDTKLIDRAIKRGVRDALRKHKKLGNPIATWENGKVVWIPARKIRVKG